jgi:hypothetical protein
VSYFVIPFDAPDAKGRLRPKYVPAMGVSYSSVGIDVNAVVWADTTPAQGAALALNADVIVIPPIDNSTAVATTQAALEAMNIPAQWVTGAMTYRDVLRAVVGMAMLIQGTQGLSVPLTLAGNLDLTMAQIPANVRAALAQASDKQGLDRSSIVGATTVRQALQILGAQYIARNTVYLGGIL